MDAAAGTFRLDGATYRPGDTVFVMPDTFDQCAAAIEDTRNAVPVFAAKSRHVKVRFVVPPREAAWKPCPSKHPTTLDNDVVGK